MAFEQTPPPPQTPTPPPKRRFDSASFYGLVIGVIILAAIIFIFRDAIAAKIAQWRGSSSDVVTVAPSAPTVSPAPTTPTPTATAVPTPKPTPKTTAPVVRVSPTAKTSQTGAIPTTGPADDLLVAGVAGGGLTAGLSTARYYYLRRKLKRQINKLDIF